MRTPIENVTALALVALILTACGSDKKTLKPQLKPLIEAVYASGNVVSKGEYQLFAQAEGYVLEKVVTDGATVKRGDAIYILESGQQTSRFELARKNFALAEANNGAGSPVLREAHTAVEAAATRLRFDSVNYIRFKNLFDQKATTQLEYDRARVQYENSQNEFRLQKSRYQRVKDQLSLELESARSQLAIAGNESGKYIIRSESSGKVFRTLKEKGELIRRGEAIAVIGDNAKFYLSLGVDELDIQRVKPGQEVVAVIDAFGERSFRGIVDRIYPYVNRQQQSLRVDVSLVDSLPQFYSGLAVEANIIINRKERTMVVPKSAVADDGTILVLEDGEEKKVAVKTGLQTLDEVEILTGITPETEILSPQ